VQLSRANWHGRFGFEDPESTYVVGVIHDIGYVVNMLVLPNETGAVLQRAKLEGTFAAEVEYTELGFTHCQSGLSKT
jgi:hypothetical protein